MSTLNYPIINTHCHILNFAFVPDQMFKILSGVPKELVREKAIQKIAQVIVNITGLEYHHLEEILELYCDNNIETAAEWYVQKMKNAGIKIATPLMMDLEACFQKRDIEPNETYIPYACYPSNGNENTQINQISKIAAKYPWQIFPFVMFDPRRKNAIEICKKALEKQGFLGIKLYPALGYYPIPEAEHSPEIANSLKALYAYCGDNRIPITVHCSTRGAYSQPNPNWLNIWNKTAPFQWRNTIVKYNLKVNFAHFGGTYIKHPIDKETELSQDWHKNILTMMRSIYRENLNDSTSSIYGDVSYHSIAHDNKLQNEYFNDLKMILNDQYYQTQVLFGSDASMLSHTWYEDEFLIPFIEHLNDVEKKRLFFENPAKFLFEKGEIPSRYIDFLKTNAIESLQDSSLPHWIVKKGDKFILVDSL